MLTHRPLTLQDLSTICGFAQSAQELYYCYPKAEYPLTVEQLLQTFNDRKYCTVIEKNNNIAGFANLYQCQHNGCCHIGNVIINPAFRQQGIAQYVINTMIMLAKRHYQAKEIHVCCFNHNTAALLLYTNKLGFTPFSIEPREYEQQKTALIHLRYVPTDS